MCIRDRDDIEYVSDTDDEGDSSGHSGVPEGTSSSSGVLQPELESGFSSTDVFTFDKYPNLYLKAKDFLRIKQAGEIEVIQDHQQRVPIYNVRHACLPIPLSTGRKKPVGLW